MKSYIENLQPKEWENFCCRMLRHQYGASNFWEVPDDDKGDFGIEFFTIDGTLFQCYYPEKNVDMATYKKKIQKKIRDDLKKLEKNATQIAEMLDDIEVRQWVLVIPEMKSKDLITYCKRKKDELLKKNLPYIDPANFRVKIETSASYPSGELFAMNISAKIVDIPISDVTANEKEIWQASNSKFADNIDRKSDALMGSNSDDFKDRVVTKYIQNERFLDQLRDDHPDLHSAIEDSALAQLDKMQNESVLHSNIDGKFVRDTVLANTDGFKKHSKFMSEANRESLSFGYLSKWIAECFMDFKK